MAEASYHRPRGGVYTPPQTNLLGWWPLTADANDLGTWGNGSLQNGAAIGGTPSALQLDGTNDYCWCGDSVNWPATVTALTVYTFIKPVTLATDNDGNTGIDSIVIKGESAYGAAGNMEFGLWIDRRSGYRHVTGRVYRAGSTGNTAVTMPITEINTTQYWQLAMTYAGGARLKLYLNADVKDSQTTVIDAITDKNRKLVFGAGDNVNQRFFGGGMGDVMIYLAEHSQTQIQEIFNGQKAYFGIS